MSCSPVDIVTKKSVMNFPPGASFLLYKSLGTSIIITTMPFLAPPKELKGMIMFAPLYVRLPV